MVAIEENLIGIDQPGDWERALLDVPHGYWHTWRASQALQLSHGSPTYLYCCSDSVSGHKAVCVYSERRWRGSVDIYNPAGFAGFAANGPISGIPERWRQFVRQRGYVCGYFALHPVVANKSAHDRLFTNGNLYVLDASIGAARLLERADSNVKRSMRKWARSGQSYIEDRDLLTDFVLREYRAFMQQKNASSTVLWSDETLARMCADPAVLMVGVKDQDGLCIVGSFATSPYGAEYHFNVNVRSGGRYTAALIFWCLERLEQMGVGWLNLGGGITPNDSVAKAKERYRPRCLPFLSSKEIYDPSRYLKLCKLSGQDRADSEGFFPSYRRGDKKSDSNRLARAVSSNGSNRNTPYL